MRPIRILFTLLLSSLMAVDSFAAGEPRLEQFDYPFPVQTFSFSSQQQNLEMAYMDVKPKISAVGTIVLLHGKNFSGAYWQETAESLSAAGYRVIIPDQIGFGKSGKPAHYQFTFQQLATNTHALLESLGITRAHVLGHSMGGMVAARYALMFPESVSSLILTNPLGLEDWKAKGVPYTSIDTSFQQELKQTPDKIRDYQRENYYDGKWLPAYERWVQMLAEFTRSPDYSRMAWNQALTSDMIYTQPVVYELSSLKVPTLLIIGQRDRTAPGRNFAPSEIRASLGDYPELGRAAAAAIPHAKLVELEGLGHLPHIEAFPRFIAPLKEFLASSSARP
jgi:pimeloyl-ACP methyl ester carboxylesterase